MYIFNYIHISRAARNDKRPPANSYGQSHLDNHSISFDKECYATKFGRGADIKVRGKVYNRIFLFSPRSTSLQLPDFYCIQKPVASGNSKWSRALSMSCPCRHGVYVDVYVAVAVKVEFEQ